MPFDSEGNFTRIHSWEDDRINDIDIVTDHHDEEDDNLAEGLSQTFLRDGRVAMRGNIDAGNFQIKNLANGALDYDAVNRKQVLDKLDELKTEIKEIMNDNMHLGDIKASLQTANHGTWLLCDGQAVSRTDYVDLFELIGTNFGAGDGVATFNLPDYRGKFLRGLGGDSAKDIYTTQEEGLPNITGSAQLAQAKWDAGPDAYSGALKIDSGVNNKIQFSAGGGWDGTGRIPVSFDAARSSAVYGKSAHVTPVNQAINYFIKAKEA